MVFKGPEMLKMAAQDHHFSLCPICPKDHHLHFPKTTEMQWALSSHYNLHYKQLAINTMTAWNIKSQNDHSDWGSVFNIRGTEMNTHYWVSCQACPDGRHQPITVSIIDEPLMCQHIREDTTSTYNHFSLWVSDVSSGVKLCLNILPFLSTTALYHHPVRVM